MAVISDSGTYEESGLSFSDMTYIVGALVSVALILGAAWWGYRMIVRDVSGIPVVQAMEGPMRIAPENPGGVVADHTGLSVNVIAAAGEAAAPANQVLLAPETSEFEAEDLAVVPVEPAPEVALSDTDTVFRQQTESVSQEQILALANRIASQSETEIARSPAEGQRAEDAEIAEETAVTPVDGARLSRSVRPRIRPAALGRSVEIPSALASTLSAGASVPSGTQLAQVGAFASGEIAAQEWDRFVRLYPDYMADKIRVIQKAQSNGKTIYRLRALGFADHDDARRFCAALKAQGTDCVAVTQN